MKNETFISNLIGRSILLVAICGFLFLSHSLFAQGRSRPAIGCAILATLFIFFAALTFLPKPRSGDTVDGSHDRSSTNIRLPDSEFVALVETKDSIFLHRVRDILADHGIESFIYNEHSEGMMSFIPDIEFRLMVHLNDLSKSKRILESV